MKLITNEISTAPYIRRSMSLANKPSVEMIKYWIKITLLLVMFSSCQTSSNISKNYPRMIGDISSDEIIDTSEFNLCNDENLAVQYYAYTKILGEKPYVNEKYELQKIFNENYNSEIVKKESGLLRLRFMINCEGKSGRFRMIGVDGNYKEIEFDTSITNQLLSITKHLVKWKPFKTSNSQRDYYMYLIFKLKKGEIIEILP